MADIINLKHYTDALRNTGYKNIESAIAEIVDNSLEAKAKDVLIICSSGEGKSSRFINEIAILDNGIGMDDETLEKALVIGESTRRERKGMGRFGVGLPQASLYVSPHVEVYSWQENGNVRKVYLDVAKIKTGEQKEIVGVEEATIPNKYKHYIQQLNFSGSKLDFSTSGTLVIWNKCDRL